MQFTIDVVNGLKFSIPFPEKGETPATITIDWGDGNIVTVPKGTKLVWDDAFTHTYAETDRYQITLTSEASASKQQIPKFNFRNRYNQVDPKKLVSLDTPLLNMNEESLANSFLGCKNLEKVAEGLFEKNTEVTDFGLCFSDCEALATVPEGLFATNTKATTFENCFFSCTNLTLNEYIFVDKNQSYMNRFKDQKMNFHSCFRNVGKNSTKAGKAPDLWNYTGNEDWNIMACFKDCRMLNNRDVPKNGDWGPTL